MSSANSNTDFTERFEHLLLSPKRVQKMLGKLGPGEIVFEQSEQAEARRRFLGVEKQALSDKSTQSHARHCYLDGLNSELHSLIIPELEKLIGDTPLVYVTVLSLNHHIGPLLDLLASNEVRVSRLIPHVNALPELKRSLIKRVNRADFKRQDAEGNEITVKTLNTALSFIGIENLRLLIVYYILKQTLPNATGELSSIQQQFRHYALGTATTARTLAQFTSISPFEAFVFGMLGNLGRHAIVSVYLRIFERCHTALLRDAHHNRQRDRHDQLLSLSPSYDYLIAFQQEYADALTTRLFQQMNLTRLNLAEPMKIFSQRDKSLRTQLPGIMRQAKRYSEVCMLHQHRCLNKSEARSQLKPLRFFPGSMDLLKSTNIFTLPLNLKRTAHYAMED